MKKGDGMEKRDILAVVAGKGGVGKASVVAGLAVAFAKKGKRVLAVDLDRYPGSLPLYCGMQDRAVMNLSDYLLGNASFEGTVLQDAYFDRLFVIAAPDREDCYDAPDAREKMDTLLDGLNIDILMFNLPVYGQKAKEFAGALAGRAVVVSTQNPVALTASADAAKEWQDRGIETFFLLNRLDLSDLPSYKEDRTDVAEMIDGVHLPLIGILPENYGVLRRTEEGLMSAMQEQIDLLFGNIAARLSGGQIPLFEGMENGKKIRRSL